VDFLVHGNALEEERSAIGCQPSAIGYRLSAVGGQLSALGAILRIQNRKSDFLKLTADH
jgi:hypothetical protein